MNLHLLFVFFFSFCLAFRFSVSIRRRVELAALLASAVLMIACYMTGADTDSNSTGRVRLVRLLLVMRCTPTIRLLAFVGDYSTFAKVGLTSFVDVLILLLQPGLDILSFSLLSEFVLISALMYLSFLLLFL